MNLRQLTAWGTAHASDKAEAVIPNAERCLTLLVEGAALNVPEIDAEAYREFRSNVGRLAMQVPDRLPEEEKLLLIRSILHEFENYRSNSEKALHDRQVAWRTLATTMFRELMGSLGFGTASTEVVCLAEGIAELETAADVLTWWGRLDEFLHPSGSNQAKPSTLKAPDHSTANDNAAGLNGGGSAVEHLRRILERGGNGFIVLFQLSCLEVINVRFGHEAVQDCLMAVSAFLMSSLHSDDQIYHWSDSSLLAILQGRPHEEILTAELQRLISQNRETTVKIGGRVIMLRIPISFSLTPIDRLRNADELYKLSEQQARKW